ISYYGEMKQCVVSIFSLIQIFKEQNFAVNLFRYTLKFSCVFAVRMVELCGIEPQTSCVQGRRSPS
ncbi:hypothetical protein OGY20_00005, partial [Citrobacter sp. Cpo114]|nr:hypothetical protein [Citrobacter sp. Cpo114]